MSNTTNFTYQQLLQHLQKTKRAVVAFSGGVDSSLLSYVTHEALGKQHAGNHNSNALRSSLGDRGCTTVCKKTQYCSRGDFTADTSSYYPNPPDRCYLCKIEIFKAIQSQAKKVGIKTIIEGSNKDDLSDYRPGMRALKELNIESPLLQLGITKETIRALSREIGLATWDKPAYACLLSRIPYHTEITTTELERITMAEMVLRELNISGSRVRSHGDIARIEVPIASFAKLLKTDLRTLLIKKIKACGYLYVTLDLEGYQTGSLNKTLASGNNHE